MAHHYFANSRHQINIKELNAGIPEPLDFAERSFKYQQLVKTIKVPSPMVPAEEVPITDEEREWMTRVGKDVKDALGSIKVQDVGQVVVGFDNGLSI
jgi:hypothetical protein